MTAALRSRRWLLWGALLALVLALLAVLVFLASAYEQQRDQSQLESDALALTGDIRNGLLRNVQTLQSLHSVAPSVSSWAAPAAELLAGHREMLRLEWRDSQLRLLAARDTPYMPDPFVQMGREQAHEFEHGPQRLRNGVAQSRWFRPDAGPVVFGCHSEYLAVAVHIPILRFGKAPLRQGHYVLNATPVSVIVNLRPCGQPKRHTETAQCNPMNTSRGKLPQVCVARRPRRSSISTAPS